MVKKNKPLKKVSKKNVEKKKSIKNTPRINRKDFEAFQFGVERLKELSKELNGLDTKKFPVEVASIRSKLKNVSQIPLIEKELKILKSKISGKYSVKKSTRKKSSKIKKVSKKVDSLDSSFTELKSEIENLKIHLKAMGDVSNKSHYTLSKKLDVIYQSFTKNSKESLKPVFFYDLQAQIKDLKRDLNQVEKKEVLKNDNFSESVGNLNSQIKKISLKLGKLSQKVKSNDELDLSIDDVSVMTPMKGDPAEKLFKKLEKDIVNKSKKAVLDEQKELKKRYKESLK